MNLNNLSPCDVLKVSTSVTLLLIEKFNEQELEILKNLLSSICCNLSTFNTQCYINKKK